MKLREIFLGKPIHWLPWPIIVVLFIWMNKIHLHVTRFNLFALSLLAVSSAIIVYLLLSSRRGEQLTREPIPEEGGPEGTGSED